MLPTFVHPRCTKPAAPVAKWYTRQTQNPVCHLGTREKSKTPGFVRPGVFRLTKRSLVKRSVAAAADCCRSAAACSHMKGEQTMARAYNIYIVLRRGHVLAAFTVRHELETWLAKRFVGLDGGGTYDIVTVRDGVESQQHLPFKAEYETPYCQICGSNLVNGVCPEETKPVIGR